MPDASPAPPPARYGARTSLMPGGKGSKSMVIVQMTVFRPDPKGKGPGEYVIWHEGTTRREWFCEPDDHEAIGRAVTQAHAGP